MIIKKAKYRNVKQLVRRQVSPDIYGCDECKKELDLNSHETTRLDITIFQHDHSSEHKHFCSWKCVLKYIPKIKSDYFASLPYLHFDTKGKCSSAQLIKLLNPL